MSQWRLSSKGTKIFYIINIFLLFLGCLTIIFPFMNILATSLSSQGYINAGEVSIFPKGFTTRAYEYVLSNEQFLNSLKISVIVTVAGTALTVILSAMAAYPLSNPTLRGRKPLLLFFVFTMMFGGGLIPSFMLIKALGMIDTIWVLFVPGAFSVYNMILIKNFMENLPSSLIEAAKIDGATEMQIFRNVILPLSKPVLATVALFSAVGFWNSYFAGIMYINTPSLKPLQTYLYEINKMVNLMQTLPPEMQKQMQEITSSSVKTATLLTATIPILIVYPFLQKHFAKGIVVGSEK